MIYHCIVIGAGASGLFYAATHSASEPMLVLEQQDRAGRKLLLSGGGKCNVTNLHVSEQNFTGLSPVFCRNALAAFSSADMLNFLKQHKIALEEREHGQIFCKHGAEKVRDLLVTLAEQNNTHFLFNQKIKNISYRRETAPNTTNTNNFSEPPFTGEGCKNAEKCTVKTGNLTVTVVQKLAQNARFCVCTEQGEFFAHNLLIATGGPAWPRAGASDAGLRIGRAIGHSIVQSAPALTPLKMPQSWPLHGLQGLSPTVTISVIPATKHTPTFTLPLLFTHSGISGPACLQISSYLNNGDALCINFLPTATFAALLDAPENGKLTPLSILRKKLPERLAKALLPSDLAERKCAELSRAARNSLAAAVHEHTVTPLAPTFAQAESSRGGINTNEVNPANMQSKLVPGLFFSGEVLDICGQLGGYNLHWAWASGYCVGRK